jgi:hypothetical protein
VQHVSMLDQPCPAQSERSESAVLDVSAQRSRAEIAHPFESHSSRQQRTCPWLKPPIRAAEAGSRAKAHATFVRPAMNAPTCPVSQFSLVIHSPRASTQPEVGGATWC